MSVDQIEAVTRIELPELECKRCGHRWTPRSPKLPKVCANSKCNSPYWNKERKVRVVRDAFLLDPAYKPSPDEIGDANEEVIGFLHDRWISAYQNHHTPYINVKTLYRRLTENNPNEKHSALIKYNIERLIVYHSVHLVTRNGVRAICFRDIHTHSHAITPTEIRIFRERINKFFKKEKKSGNTLINIEDIIRAIDIRAINDVPITKSRRAYCIKCVLDIMRFDGELISPSDSLYRLL
jgi:hypothetical protein